MKHDILNKFGIGWQKECPGCKGINVYLNDKEDGQHCVFCNFLIFKKPTALEILEKELERLQND